MSSATVTQVTNPELSAPDERRLRKLGEAVRKATIERDAALVEIRAKGPSLRNIADAVGLHASAVDQIVKRITKGERP